MAEIKGKFIAFCFGLMSIYPDAQKKADDYLFQETGIHWKEIDNEGWYDTKIFQETISNYTKVSLSGKNALKTLGKNIYSVVKRTNSMPDNLKTPLDYVQYEAEGFLQNHRGGDIVPRAFIKLTDGEVIVKITAPGYDEKLYEGVYLGLLEMAGVKTGKVENIGDGTLKITW